MPFNIGTSAAKKVFWGTTEVKKIFSGTTEVWSSKIPFEYIFAIYARGYTPNDGLGGIIPYNIKTNTWGSEIACSPPSGLSSTFQSNSISMYGYHPSKDIIYIWNIIQSPSEPRLELRKRSDYSYIAHKNVLMNYTNFPIAVTQDKLIYVDFYNSLLRLNVVNSETLATSYSLLSHMDSEFNNCLAADEDYFYTIFIYLAVSKIILRKRRVTDGVSVADINAFTLMGGSSANFSIFDSMVSQFKVIGDYLIIGDNLYSGSKIYIFNKSNLSHVKTISNSWHSWYGAHGFVYYNGYVYACNQKTVSKMLYSSFSGTYSETLYSFSSLPFDIPKQGFIEDGYLWFVTSDINVKIDLSDMSLVSYGQATPVPTISGFSSTAPTRLCNLNSGGFDI